MARKIVITSGKGGAGKTTVCANLGIALARTSQRVLMLDLDIGFKQSRRCNEYRRQNSFRFYRRCGKPMPTQSSSYSGRKQSLRCT